MIFFASSDPEMIFTSFEILFPEITLKKTPAVRSVYAFLPFVPAKHIFTKVIKQR